MKSKVVDMDLNYFFSFINIFLLAVVFPVEVDIVEDSIFFINDHIDQKSKKFELCLFSKICLVV